MNRGSKHPTTWREMVDAIAVFADLHGRWPNRSATGLEGHLGAWLREQRRFAAENPVNNLILPLPRRAYLELVITGWQDQQPAEVNIHASWVVIADQHIQQAERLGRMPRSSATATVEERTSADWFHRQRSILLNGRPTRATLLRRGYLDFHLPDWRGSYPLASEDPPLMPECTVGEDHLLAAARSFTFDVRSAAARRSAQLGSELLPEAAETGTESLIRILEGRRSHRNLSPAEYEHIQELDAAEPLWRLGPTWLAQAERVAAHHREHAAWPKRAGNERAMGTWLATQRQYAAGKRKEFLDELIPGWDDGAEQKWLARADAVARFRAETRRWPALDGPCPTERSLAKWLDDQRRALNKPHLQRSAAFTSQRRAYLTETAPGWERPDETTQKSIRARAADWQARIDAAISARDN